jgi:predicted dehydrogenase
MKFGIIGYGRMGQAYHDVLKTLDIDVEFICDTEKKDEKLKIILDYKEALNIPNIDGIIISTYGPTHYEIIKYAIEREIKYIICEKPFTTSLKHAKEITELVRKSNSKVTVNYARRFSDVYSSLIKEIHINKKIGIPKSIIITCGAGGISTMGTHFLDLCTYLLHEKVISVVAFPINKNLPNPRGSEFEDPGGYLIINFENEKRAFIDMGDDLGLQPKIEIIGSYGRIEINEITKKIIGKARKDEDQEKPMRFYGLDNQEFINESFNFESINELIKKMIKNIISDEKLKVTVEMAKDKVEIYSAIRKSFDIGEIVSLPLDPHYTDNEYMVT